MEARRDSHATDATQLSPQCASIALHMPLQPGVCDKLVDLDLAVVRDGALVLTAAGQRWFKIVVEEAATPSVRRRPLPMRSHA